MFNVLKRYLYQKPVKGHRRLRPHVILHSELQRWKPEHFHFPLSGPSAGSHGKVAVKCAIHFNLSKITRTVASFFLRIPFLGLHDKTQSVWHLSTKGLIDPSIQEIGAVDTRPIYFSFHSDFTKTYRYLTSQDLSSQSQISSANYKETLRAHCLWKKTNRPSSR